MTSGAELFARYAFPPNELGYCGPPDIEWSNGALRSGDIDDVIHAIKQFEGAWPYLELIGGVHGLDPLDIRVVEAYWIGNDLLDHVDLLTWGNSVDERFRRRAGNGFEAIDAAVADGVPNHAFHVFCVYPWVGLLRAGMADPALDVIDRCRIRWGTVDAVDGRTAVASWSRLAWDGRSLTIGDDASEVVRVPPELDGVAVGGVVALHWDHVCGVLDRRQLERLQLETARHLALANDGESGLALQI